MNEAQSPDVVCFLEHDVLYPPDYFDRVAQTFRQNPGANVVSNLDYEGLNSTGWLAVKDRHEPMHQLSMRYGRRGGEPEAAPRPSSRPTARRSWNRPASASTGREFRRAG